MSLNNNLILYYSYTVLGQTKYMFITADVNQDTLLLRRRINVQNLYGLNVYFIISKNIKK